MVWIYTATVVVLIGCLYLLRFHLWSVLSYFSARLERRSKDVEILHSLRQSLVHERKKKIAGLEMILSSWERGEEVQPRHDYFEELLQQLKDLVTSERRNLMAVTSDIFLWAKLWRMLIRIEKASGGKKAKSDVVRLIRDLARFREMVDQVVEDATERFSFSLNDAVRESLKTVRIEKSKSVEIRIEESLDEVGDTIRFSYARFKDWQRLLTNLIRNAVEAVEAKQSGAGPVAANLGLPGGGEIGWVKVTTKSTETGIGRAGVPDLREDEFSSSPRQGSPASGGICQRHDQPCTTVAVVIEDSGIGMDEATSSSFFKKGFTSGKEHGLGLGVTEESIQFAEQYGNWQIESKKGVGTKITISLDQEKARQGELILPKEKPFYRTRLAFGLYFFGLVLVGLALLFTFDKYSRIWMDWNPAMAKLVDANTVLVEAKDGRFLWDASFPLKIRDWSLVIDDIDTDEKNEVLIGTESGSRETGCLFCFSSTGNELWRFAMGAEHVFQVPSDHYSCDKIRVRDLNLDNESEILVGGENNPWFPYQVALLDAKGRMQTSYWHAGSITLLLCDDVDNDSVLEVVCGGGNNRLQFSPTLSVLEYGRDWGQSVPYSDSVLPKANEKIYVRFPFVSGLGGENDMFSFVEEFIYAGNEDGSDVYIVTVQDHRGFRREYHLDSGFTHVKRLIIHPDERLLWEKLKGEGFVDYDLTPEILESWKEIEVWKNGVKIR